MRYDFGGDGTQAIFDLTTGKPLIDATDGIVYASLTAASPLVDITADQGGTTYLDNVTTNAHGVLGRFYGPDNVKQVAVDFGSGERFLIDSNTGRRNALDAPDNVKTAMDMADAAIPGNSLGSPGGPAQLASDGRLPYAQLPVDIGVGTGAGTDVVVNGKSGPTINLTAGDVGARSVTSPILAGDVTGLSRVATTGAYGDLTGAPAAAVPLSAKGAVNGVATLDATGKIPASQLPPMSSSSVSTVGKDTDGRPYFDPAGVPVSVAVGVQPDTDGRPYFVG